MLWWTKTRFCENLMDKIGRVTDDRTDAHFLNFRVLSAYGYARAPTRFLLTKPLSLPFVLMQRKLECCGLCSYPILWKTHTVTVVIRICQILQLTLWRHNFVTTILQSGEFFWYCCCYPPSPVSLQISLNLTLEQWNILSNPALID
jgi:hypothetical protein